MLILQSYQIQRAVANKPLKALALLAGTLTHGLRHFVPNFSPCVIAP